MSVNKGIDEHHFIQRVGWLRAAVLGANDGIISTASLIIGVALASNSINEIIIAGIAALVAGAMSMAAGEFVSVSSQADTERADIEIERQALKKYPEEELQELTTIYQKRGLDKKLALQVATQLTKHDALEAHKRDELGIYETTSANPSQAAVFSAVSFAIGAGVPLFAAWLSPLDKVHYVVGVISVLALCLLGMLSAYVGGANKTRATIRIVFFGVAAMIVTGFVGKLFGTIV